MKNFLFYLKNENKIILFIYLFVFFTPIYFWDTQHSFFTIVISVFFIIKYKTTYLSNIRQVLSNKMIVYLYIYFLYTYLSLLWTNDFDHGISVQKVYREALFYVPLLYIFLEKKHVKTIFIIMSLSPALYSIYILGIYFSFYSGFENSISNPYGYLSYEKLSFITSVSIVFSLIFYIFEKKLEYKIIYFLIASLSFVGLFINDGRAGKISLFLTVMTLMFYYYRKIYSSKKITISLLIIFIIFATYCFNSNRVQTGFNELNKAILSGEFQGSWGIRLYMYIVGIEIIEDNYLIGTGTGDSKSQYRKFAKEDNSPYAGFSHMHNQHIEYLSRYGIIGYSLLLFSIVYLLYSIRKEKIFFLLGLSFYLLVFYNALFNSILDRKPVHIMFFIVFVSLCILKKEYKKLN